MNGDVGPLDEVAGVDITVAAQNVTCEKALRAAMPVDVDAALGLFDPQGRGDLPQFNGDFLAKLHRPPGKHKRWDFEVDLDLHQATGKLVSFPYPMENVSGRLEVHDGYVDIHHARMQKNGMTADIDGREIWQDNPAAPAPRDAAGKPMLGPQLTITAQHVPLDGGLLAALPPSAADWLQQVGTLAFMDVQAQVMPGGVAIADPANPRIIAAPAKPAQDVNYLVDVTLADGLDISRRAFAGTESAGRQAAPHAGCADLWPAHRPPRRYRSYRGRQSRSFQPVAAFAPSGRCQSSGAG